MFQDPKLKVTQDCVPLAKWVAEKLRGLAARVLVGEPIGELPKIVTEMTSGPPVERAEDLLSMANTSICLFFTFDCEAPNLWAETRAMINPINMEPEIRAALPDSVRDEASYIEFFKKLLGALEGKGAELGLVVQWREGDKVWEYVLTGMPIADFTSGKLLPLSSALVESIAPRSPVEALERAMFGSNIEYYTFMERRSFEEAIKRS